MSFFRKCVWMSVVLVLLLDTASAASDFASISDIKANTPARWTQTYQTQWRAVNIDTAIDVPDVSQFPIIRVTPCDPIDTQLLTNYAEVPTNEQGTLIALRNGYGIGVGTDEQFKDVQYFYDGAIPDLLSEDNPLTYQGALDIANTELARLYGSATNALSVSESVVFQVQRNEECKKIEKSANKVKLKSKTKKRYGWILTQTIRKASTGLFSHRNSTALVIRKAHSATTNFDWVMRTNYAQLRFSWILPMTAISASILTCIKRWMLYTTTFPSCPLKPLRLP